MNIEVTEGSPQQSELLLFSTVQHKLATAVVLTYMVCLAKGILGRSLETETGGIWTQKQLCLLGRGGVCQISSLCAVQEPYDRRRSIPHKCSIAGFT